MYNYYLVYNMYLRIISYDGSSSTNESNVSHFIIIDLNLLKYKFVELNLNKNGITKKFNFLPQILYQILILNRDLSR